MDDIDRNLVRIRAGLERVIRRKRSQPNQPSPPTRKSLEAIDRQSIIGPIECPPDMRLFARVLHRIGAVLRGAGRNAQDKS